MYLEHFGFQLEPFEIAPNSDFLYLSKAHKKAFTYLNYALWNKDTFTLLTGDIGSGKTILLQQLLKSIPPTAQVITLYQTQLTPYELLADIAEKLGLEFEGDIKKPKLFRLINDYVQESNRNIVMIVDEAQSFSRATLEELRLLAGIDIFNSKTNMNIILCGQPELKKIVEGGALEQLNQRIKLRFHISPMGYDETKEYISFRTTKAGQNLDIFTMDAVKEIYDVTGGVPRLINVLADTALTCGYADGFYAISSRQVKEAVNELNWEWNIPAAEDQPRDLNDNVVDMKQYVDLPTGSQSDLLAVLVKMENHLGDISQALKTLIEEDNISKNKTNK